MGLDLCIMRISTATDMHITPKVSILNVIVSHISLDDTNFQIMNSIFILLDQT